MNLKKSITENFSGKLPNSPLARIWILTFFVMFVNTLIAQIPAPGLNCIKNDTLIWNIPNVGCGPIIGYEIFYSEFKSGPYTLLTQITNPTQSTYFHSAPGKNYYYYMTTLANCSGQNAITSDTLDNFDPPLIPIEAINVIGGKCSLSWKIPITTKQLSYIIYRSTANGTLPIDTVSNTNTYLDLGSNPFLKSEAYYILSLDQCGNASIFDKPHYSIFSEVTIDSCKSTLFIKWTAYENWTNGVQEYQIWTGINGTTPKSIVTTNSATKEYLFENINDGDQLCIFVKAVESGTGITAVSNENCLKVYTVPVKWLQPYAASVLPDNTIDLKWSWNTDAEIKKAEIYSGTNNINIKDLSGYSLNFPLNKTNSFNYSGKSPSASKIYFKIKTTDLCDVNEESLPVSTIFLKGIANQNKTNLISWDFNLPDYVEVESFTLYKIINGIETIESTVEQDIRSIIDEVDIDNPEEEKICYYLTARIQLKLSDSSVIEEIIRSNTICINQFATLIFPNALIPEGLNDEFKPLTVFAQNATYSLAIFDRWGQKVFETTDINKAWKGKKNNDALPAGLYVYIAKLVQPNGRVEEKKGEVMLIR